MIIHERINEIIKAKSFPDTGLKNFVSDKDYSALSESIAKVTGIALNINTLKRIFGHLLKQDGTRFDTSPKTANILAEYLGCESWNQLCEYEEHLYNRWIKKGGVNNDSVVVKSHNDEISIMISSLRKDDIIEIKSRPNKVLRLKFLSATTSSKWYKIIDTVGSSNLQNSDEIEIPFLRLNHPLAVSQLKRKGICIGGYSAGSTQVIYSIKKINI